MYVCVYVYIYIYTYLYLSLSIYIYIHMYVCTYVCTYVRTYVRMYVCMYVCVYIHVYIYIHRYRYVSISLSLSIYIYIYIHIYVFDGLAGWPAAACVRTKLLKATSRPLGHLGRKLRGLPLLVAPPARPTGEASICANKTPEPNNFGELPASRGSVRQVIIRKKWSESDPSNSGSPAIRVIVYCSIVYYSILYSII